MNYHQLTMKTQETDPDILIAFLSEWPFESFEYLEQGVKAFILSEKVNDNLKEEINRLGIIHDASVSWEKLENINWNQKWESDYAPVEVEDFCRIRAKFHEPKDEFQYEITIHPEMAFGTGHHETTYMMVRSMRDLNFSGKNVLDFGAGTGILAILAEKMNALSIHAVENDSKALESMQINFSLNDSGRIDSFSSIDDLPDTSTYEIILANINKNVLKKYATRLHHICKDTGLLVLSGLLKEDEQEMIQLYCDLGFRFRKSCLKGEWVCLIFHKIS